MRRRSPVEAAQIRGSAARRRHLRRDLNSSKDTPMDMAREEVRNLNDNEFTETKSLEHASEQARQRNYQDFLIVDVDSHHYESESYGEIFKYIENPVIRRQAVESSARGGRSSMLGNSVGYQDIGGRITRHWLRKQEKVENTGNHRDIKM